MTTPTAWRTDEPCPVCATGLILLDGGTSPPQYECRLCGWSDSWISADSNDRDTDHLAGGGQ